MFPFRAENHASSWIGTPKMRRNRGINAIKTKKILLLPVALGALRYTPRKHS